ncbi:MAG: hypothetical protein NT167_24325 [Verrucomicrobia bacterium]|nr:hypothetical protein [Verrucomicrobiota bacterium]
MTDHAPQLTFHVSRFTFGFRISAPPRRRAAAAQTAFGTRETEPQFLAAPITG